MQSHKRLLYDSRHLLKIGKHDMMDIIYTVNAMEVLIKYCMNSRFQKLMNLFDFLLSR